MSLSSSTRTPTQGARAAGRPAAGGTNRLPNGRERRPALAALAVILILLGAAGSALIALNSGNRSDFVAISATRLEPGHKLDRKDLSRGDLAGATGGLIPWSEANKYIGQYTTGWLYKDQFVTPANFTAQKPIPTDGALVGVSLEGGRAPSDGIEVGDIVKLIQVPTSTQNSVSPSTLVKSATVTATSGALTDKDTNASTTLNVTVLVPVDSAPAVAAAAAAKTVALVKLSPTVRPEVSQNDGTK